MLLQSPSPAPSTSGQTLLWGFDQNPLEKPDACAFTDGQATLSYSELDRRSARMAAALDAAGVGPESVVALICRRRAEFLIAALGTLKASGCYLPLLPETPPQRLEFILAEAKPQALVVSASLQHRLTMPQGIAVLPTDGPLPDAPDARQRPILPQQAAYLIYTSGSTGQPKGVTVPHGCAAGFLTQFLATSGLTANDRLAATATFAFDAHLPELWGPLWTGGSCWMLQGADDPNLIDFQPNFAIFAPNLCLQLLQDDRLPASLETLILASEALPGSLVNSLQSRLDPPRIFNYYGPTEASVAVTCKELPPRFQGTPPIGRAMAHARLVICNRQGQPQPLGLPGELCVGGPAVVRGYGFRPALTAASFLPDPFSQEPGARLYRTGDLVLLNAEGDLEFLGRIDSQIKLRGFRIELGEIEAALRDLGNARAAVRLWQPDGQEGYLAAYVEGQVLPETRARLSQRLPHYMLPQEIVALERLPLTPSGKLDRRGLPEPQAHPAPAFQAPRTPTEQALAHIWSEVLQHSPIGRGDNFFRLGGHSLKATQVVARLREQLQKPVDLKDLFHARDLAELAALLDSLERRRATSLPAAPLQPDYVLSHAQKRLYLLDARSSAAARSVYNMTDAVEIEDRFQPDALKAALQAMAERHEVLRTNFRLRDGVPRQVIHSRVEVPFQIHDLRHHKAEQRRAEVRALFERERDTPFDLAQDCLARVCALRLDEAHWIIVFTLHHIIADGWSMRLFNSELVALYAALAEGKPNPLAPVHRHYKDFAEWQSKRDFTREEAYWSQWMREPVAPLPLPQDDLGGADDHQGEILTVQLGPAVTDGIQQASAHYGATPSSLVLAAFNLLLAKLCDLTTCVVAVSHANRSHRELERVIGFFVNPLLTRHRVPRSGRFSDFLAQVHRQALQAYDHQDYPFDKLVESRNPERSRSDQPLFNVCFVSQTFADLNLGNLDLDLNLRVAHYRDAPPNTAKFDLTLFAAQAPDGLHLTFEYRAKKFARLAMQRYLDTLSRFLRQIVQNVTVPIQNLRLMEEGSPDWQWVAARSQGPPPLQPSDASIADWFRRLARQHPHRPALQDRQATISYAELDQESDHIAAFIEGLAFQPEAPIGVLCDNTPELVSALLGCLKAGHPFLPLNPDLPQAHLSEMLQDADTPLLLSVAAHWGRAQRLQWESGGPQHLLCLDSRNYLAEQEPLSDLGRRELWEHVGRTCSDDISGGGWTSSFTGQLLSRAEMDAYADNIASKLQPFLGPHTQVLEIGCALGTSMFRLAPHVGAYLGTDFSGATLEKAAERRDELGLNNIHLERLAAHEITQLARQRPPRSVGKRPLGAPASCGPLESDSARLPGSETPKEQRPAGCERSGFDIVVLNSVVQSFPGYNYLHRVLEDAIELMADQGVIFLGDLMDLDLKPALEADTADYKRQHPHCPTKTDWSDELFVPQGLLRDLVGRLPGVVRAECSRKPGDNELARYRFDCILHVEKGAKAQPDPPTRCRYDRGQLSVVSCQLSAPEGSQKIHPDSAAYWMYTSGTTGKQKGVVVTHSNLLQYLTWAADHYARRQPVNMPLFTSPGFDLTITSLFLPLVTGGRLLTLGAAPLDQLLRQAFTHQSVLPSS